MKHLRIFLLIIASVISAGLLKAFGPDEVYQLDILPLIFSKTIVMIIGFESIPFLDFVALRLYPGTGRFPTWQHKMLWCIGYYLLGFIALMFIDPAMYFCEQNFFTPGHELNWLAYWINLVTYGALAYYILLHPKPEEKSKPARMIP